MRLFVAIPLPARVKEKMAELQEPVDGLRWQESDRCHLTLKFIGDANEQQFRSIDSALQNIALSRFSLQLKGLGIFPRKGNPRVLWAGVVEKETLMKLQRQVEQRCQQAGISPEQRKYIPHITLAKVKGGSKEEVVSLVNRHDDFSPDPVLVKNFVLYESRLQSDGAVHTLRRTYELENN